MGKRAVRSMNASTRAYEAWMAENIAVNHRELKKKHKAMRKNDFQFLRATFYRWAEQFPAQLPALADAPTVPMVGDVHVENFGLWRDVEGRLVWGVNDFDEAARGPYTNDLVRLL